MDRMVLGLLLTGAFVVFISIGVMMLGVALLIFLISLLIFPSFRNVVSDFGPIVDVLHRALQGIFLDKNKEDEIRNGDIQDDISDYQSDKAYRCRGHYCRFNERTNPVNGPYYNIPDLNNPKKSKSSHYEPHYQEPVFEEPIWGDGYSYDESEISHEPCQYEPQNQETQSPPLYNATNPREPAKPILVRPSSAP